MQEWWWEQRKDGVLQVTVWNAQMLHQTQRLRLERRVYCSSPLKTVCRRYTSRVMMHLWEPYFVQVFSTIEMLIIFRSAHQPWKMTFDSFSSDYSLPSTKVWAPNSILNFSQTFGMRYEDKSLEFCFNHSYLFQIWKKSARLVAEFFKN